MPMFIPLIIAAASYTAVAATAGAFIAGMMVAGGALTAIGSITGNKDMQKFGAVLSLAGGVAGLAAGASGAASQAVATETATGSLASEGLSQSAATTSMSSQAVENAAMAGSSSAATETGAGIVNSAAGSTTSAPLSEATANTVTTPGSIGGASLGGGGVDSVGAKVGEEVGGLVAGKMGPIDLNNPGTYEAANSPATSMSSQAVEQAAAAPTDPYGAGSGWGKDTLSAQNATKGTASWSDQLKEFGTDANKFLKDNKELVKVGSGIVEGAMNNKSKSQQIKDQYENQMKVDAERRARLNASIPGLQMPTYVK